MHIHPEDAADLERTFRRLVNMTPAELAAWRETPESHKVGMVRRGEHESVGRQSGAKILQILATPADDLTEGQYAHMRKVIGYCRRHLAQRPAGDVSRTRWRWSLMNWGHDPLKDRR